MPPADDHSLVPHSSEIRESVANAVLKPSTDSFIRTTQPANTIIDEHPAFLDVELALRA